MNSLLSIQLKSILFTFAFTDIVQENITVNDSYPIKLAKLYYKSCIDFRKGYSICIINIIQES